MMNYLQVSLCFLLTRLTLTLNHCAFLLVRLCGLWDAEKDWRKCRLLAWKDQIGQRKDKPLPGGNCKDLNI